MTRTVVAVSDNKYVRKFWLTESWIEYFFKVNLQENADSPKTVSMSTRSEVPWCVPGKWRSKKGDKFSRSFALNSNKGPTLWTCQVRLRSSGNTNTKCKCKKQTLHNDFFRLIKLKGWQSNISSTFQLLFVLVFFKSGHQVRLVLNSSGHRGRRRWEPSRRRSSVASGVEVADAPAKGFGVGCRQNHLVTSFLIVFWNVCHFVTIYLWKKSHIITKIYFLSNLYNAKVVTYQSIQIRVWSCSFWSWKCTNKYTFIELTFQKNFFDFLKFLKNQ